MTKTFISALLLLACLCEAQCQMRFGLTTGCNMGFVSMRGDYTLENQYRPLPALHVGLSASWENKQMMIESGLGIEGTVFKNEYPYRFMSLWGVPQGDIAYTYDVGAYVGIPVVIYPKKLPLGLHAGLKPKFEAGSAYVSEEEDDFGVPGKEKKYKPLYYFAPFAMDFLVGISIPVDFVRFSLRYERGLLNRLGNSPHLKEYDNQFKFTANFTVFRTH